MDPSEFLASFASPETVRRNSGFGGRPTRFAACSASDTEEAEKAAAADPSSTARPSEWPRFSPLRPSEGIRPKPPA
jgi:hypothetical protein